MGAVLTKAGCYIAIILLGNLLRRKGFFGPETFGVLSKIVINITLPCAIISSTAGQTIDLSMLGITLIGFGSGALYILFAFLMSRKKGRDGISFYILNTPGYNIGTFALPFTQNFLGPVGVLTTSIFDVGNAFLCFGGAFSAARAVKEGGRMNVKRILLAPLSSLPFLAHLCVVTLNLLHLQLPGPIATFTAAAGSANTFMAMLMLGVGFRLSSDREQMGDIVKILSVRFGFAAVMALCWYYLLPFDLRVRQTLAILMFSPITSAAPIYTKSMGGDEGLASAINSMSIIISIVVIVVMLTVML